MVWPGNIVTPVIVLISEYLSNKGPVTLTQQANLKRMFNSRYSQYVRRQRLSQFSQCVMGKSRQLCHRPYRINTQAVRLYAENYSINERVHVINRKGYNLVIRGGSRVVS